MIDTTQRFKFLGVDHDRARVQRHRAAVVTGASAARDDSHTKVNAGLHHVDDLVFAVRRDHHERQFHTPVSCIGRVRDTRESAEIDIVPARHAPEAPAHPVAQLTIGLELRGESVYGLTGCHMQFQRLGVAVGTQFNLAQPVAHRLDQRTVASGVFQQILLQIGIARDHPHIAENFQHHARRNAGISLYAQLIEHVPNILAEKTDHDLTVGKRGIVIRYFADAFGHQSNCQPVIRQSESDGAGQYSGRPDGFQTASLPVFPTEMSVHL